MTVQRSDEFPIRIPRRSPLTAGTLLRRYNRFLADIELDDGGKITAHCVNTGTMEGLTRPGTRVWVSDSKSETRKLRFTWELAEIEGEMIGVNTALPNHVVYGLLAENRLPWFPRHEELKREKPYGEKSRIDFWMQTRRTQIFVEVKNCHLKYPDKRAYFPDSVSSRAAGHLRELMAVVEQGHRAEVLFFCQVPGIKAVRPSDGHDPEFAVTARAAKAAGVRFSAIALTHTLDEIVVHGRVAVDLRPYALTRVIRWKNRNKELKNTPVG